MIATTNALYSPRGDNPWSSPKDHKACLSLSFPTQKDYGLWNHTPNTTQNEKDKTSTEQSWGSAATMTPLDLSFLETPTEIEIPHDWVSDDEVSLLNDNPEEDDIEVLYLPRSTYDVLVPLFDELYIDTVDKDEEEDDDHRQDQEAAHLGS